MEARRNTACTTSIPAPAGTNVWRLRLRTLPLTQNGYTHKKTKQKQTNKQTKKDMRDTWAGHLELDTVPKIPASVFHFWLTCWLNFMSHHEMINALRMPKNDHKWSKKVPFKQKWQTVLSFQRWPLETFLRDAPHRILPGETNIRSWTFPPKNFGGFCLWGILRKCQNDPKTAAFRQKCQAFCPFRCGFLVRLLLIDMLSKCHVAPCKWRHQGLKVQKLSRARLCLEMMLKWLLQTKKPDLLPHGFLRWFLWVYSSQMRFSNFRLLDETGFGGLIFQKQVCLWRTPKRQSFCFFCFSGVASGDYFEGLFMTDMPNKFHVAKGK